MIRLSIVTLLMMACLMMIPGRAEEPKAIDDADLIEMLRAQLALVMHQRDRIELERQALEKRLGPEEQAARAFSELYGKLQEKYRKRGLIVGPDGRTAPAETPEPKP